MGSDVYQTSKRRFGRACSTATDPTKISTQTEERETKICRGMAPNDVPNEVKSPSVTHQIVAWCFGILLGSFENAIWKFLFLLLGWKNEMGKRNYHFMKPTWFFEVVLVAWTQCPYWIWKNTSCGRLSVTLGFLRYVSQRCQCCSAKSHFYAILRAAIIRTIGVSTYME